MKRTNAQLKYIVITVFLIAIAQSASAAMLEFSFKGHLATWDADPARIGTELTMSLRVDNYDDTITFRGQWNNESLWIPDIHQPYGQFASWDVAYSFDDTFIDLGWVHTGQTGSIAIENSPHGAYFEDMFSGLGYMQGNTHYSLTQLGNRYGLHIAQYLPDGTHGQTKNGVFQWDSVIIRDLPRPVPEPATAVLFLLGSGFIILRGKSGSIIK